MRLDASGYPSTLDEAAAAAVTAERAGFDRWWAVEGQIDAFLACAVAAERTGAIEIGTGVAVAFARNPMTVAIQANDLQRLSGGRFVLGLGSQVKPHITRRFSMPWSAPAARMREFVLAIRAIWHAWDTGEPLDFEGDFYAHTLMPPMFDPGPSPYGPPKTVLAGVGPLMTETAGEVADGFLCHPFSTERYVREVTLPALERGRERGTRAGEAIEISAPGIVVAADTEAELVSGVRAAKERIAFYGSTPAYRPVLALHGWEGLADELHALAGRGDWDRLAAAIDDEVLDAFAIVGTPDEAIAELHRRYGDIAGRITFTTRPAGELHRWRAGLTSTPQPEGTR